MTTEIVTSFLDERFQWHCRPDQWGEARQERDADEKDGEGAGGSFAIYDEGRQLDIRPPAFKDFWRKSFYTPLLVKSDASGYCFPAPSPVLGKELTMKVDFNYTPQSQFDQAGLLLYIDEAHWMKCGIEFCDGSPRLSVVVCNEFSDWSTQPWTSTALRLKVHTVRQSSSFVVEAAPLGSANYHFVRIGHLDSVIDPQGQPLPWRLGPFAACPGPQRGCVATFSQFSVGPREVSVHSADLADHA